MPDLRPLTVADAAAAAALVNACFADHVGLVDPPPSALRETADSLAAQMASGGGMAAVNDGSLAGIVLWFEKEGGLYLGRLAVDRAFRRLGIAKALIAAGEGEARRRGLPRLHLGTRLALTGNRALFVSCGFAEVARHAHPGFDRPTWVEMEKRLAPRNPDQGGVAADGAGPPG